MENAALSPRPASKKVLIIDDDSDSASLLEALMRYAAATVMVALDPGEGLNYARWFRPDLILCDVDMPEMNGFDLRRKLSDDPALAAIPFIFISGHHTVDDQVAGLRLGAADYLSKPLSPETVLARAHFLLEKSSDSQFSGRLELIAYPELLQVLENNDSSGTLTLSGKTTSGRIYFFEGAVIGATSGDLHGEDAAAALLWMTEGTFLFEPQSAQDRSRRINEAPGSGWRVFQLLINASWLQDELAALGDRVPDKDDYIVIVDPVRALECFPNEKRWQQFVEANEAQPVSYIAQMLHIGTLRCKVILANAIQEGSLAKQ